MCVSFLLAATLALAQYGDISDLNLIQPDVKSTPAPEGAKVLFDGKSTDGWVYRKDGKSPAGWELQPSGAMQVKGGDIHTKDTFGGRFKLHVEFRVPYMPRKTGQARGNS